MEWISRSPEDLLEISREIIEVGSGFKVWLFFGTMGAGKTTLIKSICKNLDVNDVVNSPTYTLVNEYTTKNSRLIYHFDFYRINDEEEAMDIGTDEYFNSNNLCLVEWPEQIPSLLPEKYLNITISLEPPSTKRKISLLKHG